MVIQWTNKHVFRWFAALTILIMGLVASPQERITDATEPDHPNFIFMMADDLG